MADDRRGFRGPHLRTIHTTRERPEFQGPHLKEDEMETGRHGFQGPRLLLDERETHSVRLYGPDVMRRIAEKAYSLWSKRGCPQGTHIQDWIEAEKVELDSTS